MGTTVEEFRGTDKLYYAEVLKDDETGIQFGPVKRLAPVAEISRTTETSSETHYYDNKAAIVIKGEGSDTVNLTVSVLDLETLADITGKNYDSATGALLDGEKDITLFGEAVHVNAEIYNLEGFSGHADQNGLFS